MGSGFLGLERRSEELEAKCADDKYAYDDGVGSGVLYVRSKWYFAAFGSVCGMQMYGAGSRRDTGEPRALRLWDARAVAGGSRVGYVLLEGATGPKVSDLPSVEIYLRLWHCQPQPQCHDVDRAIHRSCTAYGVGARSTTPRCSEMGPGHEGSEVALSVRSSAAAEPESLRSPRIGGEAGAVRSTPWNLAWVRARAWSGRISAAAAVVAKSDACANMADSAAVEAGGREQ